MICLRILSLGIIILSINSCKDDSEEIDLKVGQNTINIIYSDTFQVDLSTVYIGDVITSNSSDLCIGSYSNLLFTNVNSEAYVQMSLSGIDTDNDGWEDIIDYNSETQFDSLVLILSQNFSYGDTTNNRILNVYQLSQELLPESNGYLYNDSQCDYYPTIISTQGYYDEDLNNYRIKLSNTLGSEFYELIKSKSSKFKNSIEFKNYFKGLRLATDTLYSNSVYSYSNPILKIYYHDINQPQNALSYSFKHNNSDRHFNKITNNRSLTSYKTLDENYNEVVASKTNNSALMLSGIDLLPKLSFPTINYLRNDLTNKFYGINKAELIIYPKLNSFDDELFYLPGNLMLSELSESNYIVSRIYQSGTNSIQIQNSIIDNNERRYYKFDITEFVKKQLDNNIIGFEKRNLLVSTYNNNGYTFINHLILDNSLKDVKLRIYYTTDNK